MTIEIPEIVQNPLLLPIVVALSVGALAYVCSRVSPLACKLLALVGSVLVLWCGIAIAALPQSMVFRKEWFSLTKDIAFVVELSPSPLGMVVLIGGAAFSLLITIYSLRAMAGEYWEGKFYAYLILAMAGSCIVGLADNLLVLLVGWELVTVMLFLMINQGRRGAEAGGAKTYGILGFADACLLLAIALLVAEGGTGNLALTREKLLIASDMGAMGYFIYVLIMIAALAKAGAIPLHTWIPSIAEDAPTPVMALLPAAMDKLLGIYLLAVLVLRLFSHDQAMGTVMMIIGAVTIIAAVLMAMMQHNLKKLLAFHAVSQVGYMVLGIGTGTPIGIIGGLFHMLNNAIYKSNLFMMSGAVGRAAGTDEIEDMGGLARSLPVTFICGLIAAMAISGVPPLNGFVSKWLVYQGTLQVQNHSLAVTFVVVAVFGSALTLASFVKVIYSAFLSPAPRGAASAGTKRPRESFFMAAPMVVLALACVVLGLWPGLAVDNVLSPAVSGAAEAISTERGVVSTGELGELGLWSPSQAAMLILIGIVLGLILVAISTGLKKVRVVRPFLGGEIAGPDDDRFRVPGTHFYETIDRIPIVGTLLKQGQQGAMDVYHWLGRHGQTFIEVLRSGHTGLVSLYVAWCLLGIVVTLVYLLLSAGM